jgi:hypothetical protein
MTISRAAELLAEYEQVGIQLCIFRGPNNDQETLELMANDLMPQLG